MLCFQVFAIFFVVIYAVNCVEDAERSSVEIIQSRGYIAEEHFVRTDDGYILGVHRIVNPLVTKTKGVVLLQHGLMASSSCFLVNSADGHISDTTVNVSGSLGFALAKEGYDVWLGNSRGNRYSTNHTILKDKEDAFWEFTFNEMANYDLPATLRFIREYTNSTFLRYVGHSQGTAIMFALLSEKPYFSKYVKPFVAVAPVTVLQNTRSPINKVVDNFLVKSILRSRGKFGLRSSVVRFFARYVCNAVSFTSDPGTNTDICQSMVFSIVGYNPEQMNKTRLEVYLHHMALGTSNWNVHHLSQLMRATTFQKYNHGSEINKEKYKQITPPVYDLSRINSPNIALVYGNNDLLVDVKDVFNLKNSLKVKLLDDYLVPDPHWNHLDFLFGKDAGKQLRYAEKRINKVNVSDGIVVMNLILMQNCHLRIEEKWLLSVEVLVNGFKNI